VPLLAMSHGLSEPKVRPAFAVKSLIKFPTNSQGVHPHMTSKVARFLTASAFVVSITMLAQTDGTAAAGLPAAPSSASAPVASGPGNKIGTINIEQAIFASNEGQRDFEVLSKKLEPKQTELKGQNDEIESLKKQLNTQGDKLNDETRGNLVKQIEQKQKSLERAAQDAREDAQNQQNEIAQRILQKMAPLIVKYAGDNGFGLIFDTSNPWPNGPVLWAGPTLDITKTIVDSYNTQSGVAAPVRPAGTTRPSTSPSGTRSTTPGATKPATTQPAGTQAPK
jgi:outer membrane protein